MRSVVAHRATRLISSVWASRQRLLSLPLALSGLGAAMAIGYVLLWPLSYRLTHGYLFTNQYLVAYPEVWLWLLELLAQWESWLPSMEADWRTNVDGLMLVFAYLFLIYLAAVALVYRKPGGRSALLVVLAGSGVFQLLLFLMPGVFTSDLFSYSMYGHMAAVYGANPYLHAPLEFPDDAMAGWIHPMWQDATAVYGPVWLNLSAVVSWLTRDLGLVERVLAYKLVANVLHVANLRLLWVLLGHLPPRTRLASFVLFAWNPLLLFEIAGNGHNDVLMLTFLFTALLLYLRNYPASGLMALGLSIWSKYTSLLILPLYLVMWSRTVPSVAGRVRIWALGGVAVVLTGLLMYLPWLESVVIYQSVLDWSRGWLYTNYVPDLVSQAVAREVLEAGGAGPNEALEQTRGWAKQITRALFLGYFLFELKRAWGPRQLAESGARLFLAFLLVVHTWVLSWYFTWPLALVAIVGPAKLTTQVVVGFTFTSLALNYYHQYWADELPDWALLLYLFPLLLPAARWLGGRAELAQAGRRAASFWQNATQRFRNYADSAAGDE